MPTYARYRKTPLDVMRFGAAKTKNSLKVRHLASNLVAKGLENGYSTPKTRYFRAHRLVIGRVATGFTIQLDRRILSITTNKTDSLQPARCGYRAARRGDTDRHIRIPPPQSNDDANDATAG